MEQASADQVQPSPHAERLRVALGWERLPEMPADEREAFEAEQRELDEEVRRYYGKSNAA